MLRPALPIALLVTCAASAQTVEHTFVLDAQQSVITWEVMTLVGPIPGIPDNTFELSGTTTINISKGEVDPYSTARIVEGDLTIPYLLGEIPLLVKLELPFGGSMSITTSKMKLGDPAGPEASGVNGVIDLTGGDLYVWILGQGPTIIPLNGTSDPFPVFSQLTFDAVTGDMHLETPIDVNFELVIANTPLTFSITGTVVQDYVCPPGQSYCVTSPNSAGAGAVLSHTGSTSYSINDLTLHASGCPPGQFGLFFYGPKQQQVALGDGFLCVKGGAFRMDPIPIDGAGMTFQDVDVLNPPEPAGQVHVGETWNYQLWYRDPTFGNFGYNFSDGLSVQWRL